MASRQPGSSQAQKYREFLEVLGAEFDRRQPGVFEWRFGKPAELMADGLIITKADVGGYVFALAVSQWRGGEQGGVWNDGAHHTYCACIFQQRDWELPEDARLYVQALESRSSDNVADIVDWIIEDWAYERPWRPPRPTDHKAEKKRLQKVSEGLKNRSGLAVVVNARPDPAHNLTSTGKAALKNDLAGLQPDQIRSGFPSDARGALALNTVVLLASYETTSPPARDRKLCLTAVGPQRRSDPQEIRIQLEALITPNQDHCWEQQRWRWHADSVTDDTSVQWGTSVPIQALAAGTLSISQLTKKVEKHHDSGDKAALAILLQDEGHLLEALELYGVEIDKDLKRLCGGQKIYPPACCAHADEKWVQKFQDWMRECAPWLLGSAVKQEAERIAAWSAEKKGRRRRPPLLKLLIFPGQHHSRKASLMLTSDLDGTKPQLVMDATAGNTRLHESGWKRPLEIDLARYQLE